MRAAHTMFRTSQFSFHAGTLCLALALTCIAAGAQDEVAHPGADVPPILKIGSPAPDFNLPGIDGKMHSLREYSASKVLVLIFTCDHCPVAQMYEKRIKQLTSDYLDRGVAVVAINPNDPKAVHLSEMGHSDMGDTLTEMKIRAEYRHFNFPYLSDGATQAVALKYGPTATPHAFIFDKNRILRYQGRIDSSQREELVTKHEARDAIEALLAGKPVEVQNTPAVGCSTKWAYKEAGAKAEVEQSQQTPVAVDLAGVDQLKALRKNNTGKFVLVNFWATWCEPCVAEFPELQKMIQMYRKRPFEIVTVSINTPDEKKGVLSFLQEQHAVTKNLLFSFNDPAEGVAAFGTDWSGGVPYTVLLSPEGEVLYRSQGAINPLEVRRTILKYLPDDHYIGTHAYWNSSF
jgi:peroxiredoxin